MIPQLPSLSRNYCLHATNSVSNSTSECPSTSPCFEAVGALDFTVPGKHHRALHKTMFCLAFHAFLRIGEMNSKNSKGKPLTLTMKGTTSPQDCPHHIMKAYLSVRDATAGPLFLYCPRVPVTRAKFNEQLRGALQFCHFCPKTV